MVQGGKERPVEVPFSEQSIFDDPRAVLSWIKHLKGFAGTLISERPAGIDPDFRQTDIVARLLEIREANERQFVEWLKKQWEEVNQEIEGLPFDHVDMRGNPWRVAEVRGSLISEVRNQLGVNIGRSKTDHGGEGEEDLSITFLFDRDNRLKLKSVRVFKITTTPNWSDSRPRGFLEQRYEDLYSVRLGKPDGRVRISWKNNQKGSFSFPLPAAESVPAAS